MVEIYVCVIQKNLAKCVVSRELMWFLVTINGKVEMIVVGQGVMGSLNCDSHASRIINLSVMLKGVARNKDESQ